MAADQAAHYRLDDEQRARVRDCLTKDGQSLPIDRFERLIRGIEASIVHFLASAPQGAFRDAHDALRHLWEPSHDDDPPVALIRARIQALPREAIEYVDRRAPIVIARLFPAKPIVTRFREWAATADPAKLITATKVLSGEGGHIVEGRSRGAGKRSRLRLEPMITGEVRGTGTDRHRGGRPENADRRDLVIHLATDWLGATGEAPKPGRSDSTGFGDLAHSVFQWLSLPEGSAAYALRQYWADVKRVRRGTGGFPSSATAKNSDLGGVGFSPARSRHLLHRPVTLRRTTLSMRR
jgi:hypothetical protein